MTTPDPQAHDAQAYDALLAAFATHVGLGSDDLLRSQEITVDGLSIGLACESMNGLCDVLYFAELGAPSPQRAAQVHRGLLEANNMWAGTGGATLGLQEDTGCVVMAGRLDVQGLTPESLANALGMFAELAGAWKHFVDDTHSELDGAGDASTPDFALRA